MSQVQRETSQKGGQPSPCRPDLYNLLVQLVWWYNRPRDNWLTVAGITISGGKPGGSACGSGKDLQGLWN